MLINLFYLAGLLAIYISLVLVNVDIVCEIYPKDRIFNILAPQPPMIRIV